MELHQRLAPLGKLMGYFMVGFALMRHASAQVGSDPTAVLAAQLGKLVNSTLPNYVKFGYGAAPNENYITKKGGISARPVVQPLLANATLAPKGVMKLGLSTYGRDGYVYVPASYMPAKPAPLILALHGANRTGLYAIAHLYALANQTGTIVVAPDSRDNLTWDMFTSGWGKDVAFINGSLAQVFDMYRIDPRRVALEGFSDGATYALSLGVANGGVFTHVMAFSPGGLAPPMLSAIKPAIFVSAGRSDAIFPISDAGTPIVCQLLLNRYNVTYSIFPQAHELPPRVVQQAFSWFLAPTASTSVPLGTC